ncbi:hypothetical protein MG293_001840 [Ovis ammon polii]|uniref:Uncharacterized protein n=1 Tax=Ovis ammon polii TaxID=230172 RepID=A0AAD4URL3_OVIAM|nr:hypothetical protein MG293_001840 [Ovis ammon polii]
MGSRFLGGCGCGGGCFRRAEPILPSPSQPLCRRPQVRPSSMFSQTRFSLLYSLAALRFRYDLWKKQIYPSNPYPFADTIGAVPRVSSEPISSRVLHRFGSLLPPSLFHSPAPRPPLSSPLAPLLSAPDSTLCFGRRA